MRIRQDNITIELENQEEIDNFWNIVAFALDLHAERREKDESCMTDDELKMAHKLYDLTKARF